MWSTVDRGMAHRVDRVGLVIVSSETKPLPTTPFMKHYPGMNCIFSLSKREIITKHVLRQPLRKAHGLVVA